MITEDYVSFETAQLLKEKWFDCRRRDISAMYNEDGKLFSLSTADKYYYDYDDFDDKDYIAPTLQMVMKWLRKVHRIDIEVRTHYLSRLKPNDVRYYSGKILKGSEDVIYTIYSKDTSEEVCEEAIKYCCENLI